MNQFSNNYPDAEFTVWTDQRGLWYAHATYTMGDRPTYCKPEDVEEPQVKE